VLINLLLEKKFIPLKIDQCLNSIMMRYISIKTTENLLNVSKKSICCIGAVIKGGTGFLVKLSIASEKNVLFGLMTNNHVINADYIKCNENFKIYFNSEDSKDQHPYTISIDENNFIFTSELIDITFIQLHDEFVKNPEFDFLDLYCDECNKQDEIYIFQYPKGKLSFAKGKIEFSFGFNYFHVVSTDEGSSGSPLLNETMKVVGVHKGRIKTGKINVDTKISIVKYAINTYIIKVILMILKKQEKPLESYQIKKKKN